MAAHCMNIAGVSCILPVLSWLSSPADDYYMHVTWWVQNDWPVFEVFYQLCTITVQREILNYRSPTVNKGANSKYRNS